MKTYKIIFLLFVVFTFKTTFSDYKQVYVTTFSSKGEYHSFSDIHLEENIFKRDYKTLAYVSRTDEESNKPNALIYLRGDSTRKASKKSYRIKYLDPTTSWYGYDTLNLLKSPFDTTKIRTKISYDVMKGLPSLISPNSEFVKLYIKDSDLEEPEFKDYGVFTQVESVNKDFFRKRSIPHKGYLYKMEEFEFQMDEVFKQILRGEKYSKDALEELVEPSDNKGIYSFAQMVFAINNPLVDINNTIDKYFDLDNYLTWLALNIIIDNIDTNSQNFILYQRPDTMKWIFIPWDYDSSWGYYDLYWSNYQKNFPEYKDIDIDLRGQWKKGVSNFWGVSLHNRFLRKSKNRKLLSDKIDFIINHIENVGLDKLISSYKPVIDEIAKELEYFPLDEFFRRIDLIKSLVPKNLKMYQDSLKGPMPVFMGEVKKQNGFIFFNWDPSYSFEGLNISYKLEISRDIFFTDIKYTKDNIKETSLYIDQNLLEEGKYFWRLNIKDSNGNTQKPFSYSVLDLPFTTIWMYGIREFYLE